MMTPEQYAAAVDQMVAEVIDDHLVSGLVLLTERNGKQITEEQARSILRTRDERVFADVLALADEWQATYDRWRGVSDGPRVDIFRAHANRLRKALGR